LHLKNVILQCVVQELFWIHGSTSGVSPLSLRTISIQIRPEGSKKQKTTPDKVDDNASKKAELGGVDK
jgi:hypothetical protein